MSSNIKSDTAPTGFLATIERVGNKIPDVTILFVYALIICFMASALVVLSMIDFRTFEIPFGINVFIFLIGIVRCMTDAGHLASYAIGFIAVSGFLLLLQILSKGRAIGGGDVKLMAAAGLLLGWKLIILAFVLGCIIGSVIHLIRMKVSGEGHLLAMGPYLSVGIWIAALWGTQMLDAYFNLFI